MVTDPGLDRWKYYGFTGYKLIDTAMTHADALSECQSYENAQLVEINTLAEEEVLLYLLEYMRQQGNGLQSSFLGK